MSIENSLQHLASKPEPVSACPLSEDSTAATAFLSLIDRLDHVPGAIADAATAARRWASMTADAGPADDDSPAFRAFHLLARCRRIGRKQLLAAHALLCPDAASVGGFRRHGCQVRCPRTGVNIYLAPDAAHVPALVDGLIDVINDAGADDGLPFIALLRLLRIHPFTDGNGRLARVLFAALCWREGRRHPAWLLALRRLSRFDGQAIRAGSFAVGESGDWRPYLVACDRALAEATVIWRESDVDRCDSWSADALAALWARCSDGFPMPSMSVSDPAPQQRPCIAANTTSANRMIAPSRMPARPGVVLARVVAATFVCLAAGNVSAQGGCSVVCAGMSGDVCIDERIVCDNWGGETTGWGGNTDHYDNNGPGGGGPPFEGNPGDNEQVRDAGEKDCEQQRANPVVLTTGNKIESAVDFASEGEMGLFLHRRYNHYWSYLGLFGQHWVSNFDYSLVPQGSAVLWAQRPDGRRIKFVLNTANNRFEEDKGMPVAYIVKHADGSFTHHTEDRHVETYDNFGYVQTVHNRHGIGWTFAYADNRLQTVTHTSGRQVQFTWTFTRLTRVTDPDGAHYDFTYDEHQFGYGRNRLVTATLPGPPATTVLYHYENATFPGAMTGVSYAGARLSTFAYDAQGRAIRSEHQGPSGVVNRVLFAYDGTAQPPDDPPWDPPPPGGHCDPDTGLCFPPQAEPGDPDQGPPDLDERTAIAEAALATLRQPLFLAQVTETNALDKVTEYTLDAQGRITEVNGLPSPHCGASHATRTYGLHGFPFLAEDFNGNTVRHDYIPNGQLQSKVDAYGSDDARTTSYLWDKDENRIDRITVTGDHVRSFTWRTDHRLGAVTVRNIASHGVPNQERSTGYSYTFHGNGLMATMVEDGPLPGTGDAITYTYSAQGDLTQIRNSRNHAISYSQHNGRGQPGRIVGANGEATEFLYDDRGRITRLRTFRDGGQQDVIYSYNAGGLLTSIAMPDGVTESYTYDSARRLKTLTRNEPGGSTVREWFYDAASNATREELRRNGQLVQRVYMDYDELNRVRARRGNDGQHLRYTYTPNGEPHQVIRVHPGGETILATRHYDARNRLRELVDANGGQTRFAYNHGDRIAQVTDPRNRITEYRYDGFGQLWTHISPDTGTTAQFWTAGGLRESALRGDGVTVTYGHDELGRPTTVTALGQTQTTVWDTGANCGFGIGRICRIDDPHQSLELGYGRYGELTLQRPTIAGQAGYLHRFEYDAHGRLSGIEYPDDVRVDYAWTLGQITAMTATVNGQARPIVTDQRWQHSPANGAYFRQTYAGNRNRDTYVDTDGRPWGIVTDLHQGFSYDFDDRNRITALTNLAASKWSQNYGYDHLDRLTSATGLGGNQSFGYDASGNRTSHVRNSRPPARSTR